jgi:hypothetical protein
MILLMAVYTKRRASETKCLNSGFSAFDDAYARGVEMRVCVSGIGQSQNRKADREQFVNIGGAVLTNYSPPTAHDSLFIICGQEIEYAR